MLDRLGIRSQVVTKVSASYLDCMIMTIPAIGERSDHTRGGESCAVFIIRLKFYSVA